MIVFTNLFIADIYYYWPGRGRLRIITISKINTEKNYFNVDIIPYTFNNTNLKDIVINSTVNIEFDILAKQIANLNYFKS